MSSPQPPVLVEATPPPPQIMVVAPRSIAGELARWSTGGILIGMPVGVIVGIPLGFFGFFLGIAVGGTFGFAVAATLLVVRRRVPGYGSAKRILRVGAVSTWIQVAGLVTSVGVGVIGSAAMWVGSGSSVMLAAAGATGVLAAVLLFFGAAYSPERDFSRTTGLIVGPILFVVALGFAWLFNAQANDPESGEPYVPPPDPEPQVVETAPPPFAAPHEGDLTSSDRIPAPAPLVSDQWDLAALLEMLADEADRSLEVAVVDDPDIQSNVRFLPVAVYCQWEQFAPQATIDIWFDTADDAAAMFRVRDYWLANGYQLVTDDADLIVVNGVEGLLGAQYSLEKTWDDELRLRMQTACVN